MFGNSIIPTTDELDRHLTPQCELCGEDRNREDECREIEKAGAFYIVHAECADCYEGTTE